MLFLQILLVLAVCLLIPGLILFFIITQAAVLTTLTAIIIGVVAVIMLVSTCLGISYFFKKSDYRPSKAKQSYLRVESDLKQIAADLTEIRLQLDNIAPYLREMEFLRYARQNRESKKNEE